jgi:hypothetical protein
MLSDIAHLISFKPTCQEASGWPPRGASMPTILLRTAVLAMLASSQAGCWGHLGPRTIVADRVAYTDAIATSWQEQTLLNIVKLRYLDTPFFVDVAQMVGGYTLGTQITPTLGFNQSLFPHASFGDRLVGSLPVQEAYLDRPTVSYNPQTRPDFIRNLALPLPPTAVLYMMQAGYPVDLVFDLTLDAINGIQGRSVSGVQVRPASPQYRRVVEIIRKGQLSGHVGMRIEVGKDKKESLVMFFRDPDIDPDLAAQLNEARKLLGIDPAQREVHVVFGATRGGPNEVTMATRSLYRVLIMLATSVQVPDVHLAEGRAPSFGGDVSEDRPRFTVLSGCEKPKDYFTATQYRGHWFWIDDRDLESKRTMAYLMVLLALADTGAKEPVPFLTIQAN